MPRYGYKPQERKFRPVEAGMHPAHLIHFIDLGTHSEDSQKYGRKEVRKGRFTWALPDSLTDDGRPMVISSTMTLSPYERSNFRKMCSAWLSRAFSDVEFMEWDERELFNVPCNLNIAHKTLEDGSVMAVVQSAMPLMRNQGVAPLSADTNWIYLSLNPELFDVNEFAKLDLLTERTSAMLKGKIQSSPEWGYLMSGAQQPAEAEPEREWHTEDPLPAEDVAPVADVAAGYEDENPAPPEHRQPAAQPQRPAPQQPAAARSAAVNAPAAPVRPAAPVQAQRPAAPPAQRQPAPAQQAPASRPAPAARPAAAAPPRPTPAAGSISQRAAPAGRPAAPARPTAHVNDKDLNDEIPF